MCTARDEEGNQPDEQHQIARVGEGDAIGIVGHEQHSAPSVRVVGRLIETVARMFADAVHRDVHLPCVAVLLDGEIGLVVHHRIRAGIVHDVEVLELQAERHLMPGVLPVGKGCGGLALSQMQAALGCPQMGDQGSRQHHDERKMDQQYGGASMGFPSEQTDHRQHGGGSPQQDKPPRAIDESRGAVGAPNLLDDGGNPHTHHEQCVQG